MNTPTTHCELLMNFLLKHNCIKHPNELTKSTCNILKHLYTDLKHANTSLKTQKKQAGVHFYNVKLAKIHKPEDIPQPASFSNNSMDPHIKSHIDKHSYYKLTYTLHLLDDSRTNTIHFIIEKSDVEEELDNEPNITMFNKYVDNIILWLSIINKYSSNKCVKDLSLFIYFTSLTKILPENSLQILNQLNINTAFTYNCPKELPVSEIVIFRKEEWFKVLIHETLHTFGLDFGMMDNDKCHSKILSLFPLTVDVRLYESYVEFWGKMMNILIFSFNISKGFKEFLKYCEFMLNYERAFCFLQMAKVLKYMNLTYSDLYTLDKDTLKDKYKEDTSVFAYYVVTVILLDDYSAFLEWCSTHNSLQNIIQFKQTEETQEAFCQYIESKYKTADILKNVSCAERFVDKLVKRVEKTQDKNHTIHYILKNLRLSLCELTTSNIRMS